MSMRADSLAEHGAEGRNGGDVRLGELLTDVPASTLAPQERAVLIHWADGLNMKETAEAMALSVKTVDCYRGRIVRKTGIRRIGPMVRYAIRQGLIQP